MSVHAWMCSSSYLLLLKGLKDTYYTVWYFAIAYTFCWYRPLIDLDGCCKLRLANIFGDHMVLQKAPRRAILWGYADVIRDTVTVLKNGVNVGHTTVFRNATGKIIYL